MEESKKILGEMLELQAAERQKFLNRIEVPLRTEIESLPAFEDASEDLMNAILMMRETNPNNLNYPYMLEDYTANIMMPKDEKDKMQAIC